MWESGSDWWKRVSGCWKNVSDLWKSMSLWLAVSVSDCWVCSLTGVKCDFDGRVCGGKACFSDRWKNVSDWLSLIGGVCFWLAVSLTGGVRQYWIRMFPQLVLTILLKREFVTHPDKPTTTGNADDPCTGRTLIQMFSTRGTTRYSPGNIQQIDHCKLWIKQQYLLYWHTKVLKMAGSWSASTASAF